MAYKPVLTSHVNEPNSYTLDFYMKNLRGYEGLRKEQADLRHALRDDPRSWSAWLSLGVASTGRERAVALDRARSLNPLAPELGVLGPATNP